MTSRTDLRGDESGVLLLPAIVSDYLDRPTGSRAPTPPFASQAAASTTPQMHVSPSPYGMYNIFASICCS